LQANVTARTRTEPIINAQLAPGIPSGECTGYILGHAVNEQQRLIDQARFLGDLTAEVWRQAGLREGMCVLDIGCGVGDTTFLAASLVGPSGYVIGVDQSALAIVTAKRRADDSGIKNVRFVLQNLDDKRLDVKLAGQVREHVDALTGRLVLLYLADPAATLRRLKTIVRPGGIIAFQDIDGRSGRSEPHCPLYETTLTRLRRTFERAGIDISTGPRLGRIFEKAGLPAPSLTLGARIERGTGRGICEWTAGVTRTVLPSMVQSSVATLEQVDIDTLADRLHAEALTLDATLTMCSLIGAWTNA
jgi:ubiquinone/menaquinone biosynthesis C-methylase UbiE